MCSGTEYIQVAPIASKTLVMTFYVTNDRLLFTFTALSESKTIIYVTRTSDDKENQTYLSVLAQKISNCTQILSPFLVFGIFSLLHKNYTDLVLTKLSKKFLP